MDLSTKIELTGRLLATAKNASQNVAGVSVGAWSDKATWRVDYVSEPSTTDLAAVAEALAAFDPNAVAVPESVTDLQARLVLSAHALLPAVEAAVAAAGGATAIWFDRALIWRRDNQHVALLGAVLGLSPAQIDALFIEAAAL